MSVYEFFLLKKYSDFAPSRSIATSKHVSKYSEFFQMNQKSAEKILKETEFGYDSMAVKFSETRKYFWRGLEFIADYTQKGDKVLDFGCGNGRLLELIGKTEDMQYSGTDVSQKLTDIAKQHYQQHNTHFQKIYPVKSAEGGPASQEFNGVNPLQITLPFADDYFNTVYSIAVFHHFPSRKYREDVAKELYRVTKKDGHIVITVWNLWQKRYIKNIIKNWVDKLKGDKNLDWNDCNITFKDNQGKIFNRYHHAFTKRELYKLFSNAGFQIEKCEIINGRNIILIGKK